MRTALIMGFGASALYAQCPSSLGSAWQSLLATHPAVAASKSREDARSSAVVGARASLLPRLDATAGYQYVTEVPSLDLTLPIGPGGKPVSLHKELGTNNRTDLGLTASYLVFSGFSQSSAQAREERGLEAAQLDSRQVRAQLALQLGIMDLSLRSRLVDLRQKRERLTVREAWLTNWQAREKSGIATKAQVLNAKAEMLAARTDTTAIRRQIDSLRTEFVSLSGTPWTGNETDTALDKICPEAVPTAAQEPWNARSLKTQTRAIEESRQVATAAKYPWITASLSAKAGDPGVNQTEGWMTWGVAAVQMQWNLFDGFERSSTSGRLSSEARTLELESARLTLTQKTQWETLAQERQNLSNDREALQAALDASLEAETALKGALSSGTSLPDDLRDAGLRSSDLRTRLSQLSLRDAMLALRLRSLSGELLSFEGTP
jgi:outer membrane protein, adhesin transport system